LTKNELNFSGGPGALPLCVLEKTQRAISCLDETGISLLGMSHRSDWYEDINRQAQNNLRDLLSISSECEVIFLQGGGSLQFSMIPMNFLNSKKSTAQYIVSGYWSQKSVLGAESIGQVQVIWDGKSTGYKKLPDLAEIESKIAHNSSYLHYVSNETVEGLSFGQQAISRSQRLICDMSSDLLSKPIQVNDFSLIYAHAQKNLGPSGVTVVIVKKDLLEVSNQSVPPILSYREHSKANSILNTPPVFSIYVLKLVTDWLINQVGGLEEMSILNKLKSKCIYESLDDGSDFYRIHADKPFRSDMNIAFSLRAKSLEDKFLESAKKNNFTGLEGHRSIGGLRVSLYNAVSVQACERLASFMDDFRRSHP
jgi:phosphoserine aminotransferase